MKIVSLASEAAPWARTGGLGDVAGALPQALAARGHEVHTVLPLYSKIARERYGLRPAGFDVEAWLPGGAAKLPVWTAPSKGVKAWFLEHPSFDRAGLYGPGDGDYGDNHVRFALWTRGALEVARRVNAVPDVLHLHDWQAAVAAVDLRGTDRYPDFASTKIVFTIHNLGYSGSVDRSAVNELGLPASTWDDALEFWGRASMLKGGLVYADALTTVSPRYAQEIRTPAFGHGLDGLLRARSERLSGILNGIDTDIWNPATDPLITARFDKENADGKRACKEHLQRELGLQKDPGAVVLGVVSRLAWQKGIDLVAELADTLVHHGAQLALLGTGESGLEDWLEDLARRHPGRIAMRRAFDDALSHRIVAGSDALLVPSRYEPCGLTQMYAMRYGTVPVVRAVGGLDDTVEELDAARGTGTGFKFGAATGSAFWAALQRVLQARRDPAVWTSLAVRGMSKDFSWDASAAAYEQLFAAQTAS